MRKYNDFNEYIKEVCSQIRTKQVHDEIEQELMCHMQEQKQSYMDSGADDATALQKTMDDMGDATLIEPVKQSL